MLKKLLFIFIFFAGKLSAQEPSNDRDSINAYDFVPAHTLREKEAARMYHLNYKVDVPIIVVGGAATLYSFTIIYTKKNTPVATIQALNKNDIPSFDRWATRYHDLNMDKISYYPFYAAMPLPLILLADKKISKDAGRIGMLYLEAFAFTGVIYAGSVYFVDRYRPDVYNTSLDMSYRTNGNFRNSFFAGHVAVMATSTFFIAKVFDDYHPHSGWKWAVYGGAAAATIGMSYMRLEAGKHFPSDILLGAAVGVASGLLTPTLHKNKNIAKQKWSLSPGFMDKGAGLAFTYKL
jgi:membrane-associated phospholipid phosphatase